jgi:F-type H+-transporting ATPase subunit epsilon
MADAAASKITLDLVSPEQVVLSQPVDMAVIPGAEGLFAVLGGHAPLIAALRPGVVQIYANGKISQQIFVDGGFAEVTAERCVVLAEQAVPLAQLDRAQIAARVEELKAAQGAAALSAELPISGVWPELLVKQAMLAAIDAKTI